MIDFISRVSREINQNRQNLQLIVLANFQSLNNIKKLIQTINSAAKFYTDSQECIDVIKTMVNEKLLLIVSDSFVSQFLPVVHDLEMIVGIYIIDIERQSNDLREKYSKIIDIISINETLLKTLRNRTRKSKRIPMIFSLFDQKQMPTRDLTKESATFLWCQMLIYVLKQMPHDDHTMNEMLNQCAQYYRNNQMELEKIDLFRKTYTKDQAIFWYTNECFLSKLLYQALYTENIQLLHSVRFFIIDLCSQLERESNKIKGEGCITVYRGQMMQTEELGKLQHNIGRLISTNGFFSTSRDINISLGCLTEKTSSRERIIFEIQVDPSVDDVIYADVSSFDFLPWKREVLFSLNTVFQIISVDIDSIHDTWKVKLQASNQGIKELNEYMHWLQTEIDKSSPLIYFGRLLWSELAQFTKAKNYFKMLFNTLPADHPDISFVSQELSRIFDEEGNYDLALRYCERALRIRRKQKPIDTIRLGSTLSFMGVIYKHKGDPACAIDYYEKALGIYRSELSNEKQPYVANAVANLGNAYKDKGFFDVAIYYLTRAYEIYRDALPADHPHLVDVLSNIGSVYHYQENFDQAITFYQQALNIQDNSCPDDNLRKANTIRNIALIYRDQQDFNNAMNLLNRALIMYRYISNDIPHPNTAICYGDIGHVYEKMGDWDQALKFYDIQFQMEELCLSVDHPHLALHFDWIIKMMKKKDKHEQGRELCQKELNKLPNILGKNYANHPRYAHTLVSLAKIVEDHDFKTAEEYYKEALQILEQHPHSKAHQACLSAIVNFFSKNHMNSQALLYQMKLVNLQRTTLSPYNKELAVSLRDLAHLYQTMNDDTEADIYFRQSLEIFQEVYQPGHNLVEEILQEQSILRDSTIISDDAEQDKNDDTHLNFSPYDSIISQTSERQNQSFYAQWMPMNSTSCTLL